MSHVYGWGKVYIAISGISGPRASVDYVLFNSSYAEPPEFDPKEFEWEDDNGDTTIYHQGDRAKLRCHVYNLNDTDAEGFKTLASLISRSRADRLPLLVYPKYDITEASQYYYECWYRGPWKPEDLTQKAQRGQKIVLEFTGKQLIGSLPAYTAVSLGNYRVTEDGVTRITESSVERAVE